MVKVSQSQTRKNYDAVRQAADVVARREGLLVASVHGVAREAGLTHGAIYKRFDSRSALMAAGLEAGFDRMVRWFRDLPDAQAYRDWVTAAQGRDATGVIVCPALAHAAQISMASAAERAAWRAGYEILLKAILEWPDITDRSEARGLLAWAMADILLPR